MNRHCLFLACLGLIVPGRAAEVLHYNLLPGSTITPYLGSDPTGPAEPLSGHLDWVSSSLSPPILSFDTVELSFQSESFSMVLDRTSANDVATAVHTDSQTTVFDEVADLTGFDIPTGYLSSLSPGTYYGPATRPVVLHYPNVRISPLGGGTWRAKLDIVAAMDGFSVNVAPSFTKGPDLVVPVNAGPQFVSDWATDISPGAAGETGQTLTFITSTDNNALFSVLPVIAANGTLTFTLAPGAIGSALVSVVLRDNGGTAFGGQDSSQVQTFTISIVMPNVAPSFVKGPDLAVLKNRGPQIVPAWATEISPGPPAEAGQILTFLVRTDNDALFSVPPALAPDGTLTFTPAHNAIGVAHVTVLLRDSGGTAFGGQDTSAPQIFTISVLSPSQAALQLIWEVQDTPLEQLNKRPLLATLEAAAASLQRGNLPSGTNQLEAFQRQATAQLDPSNSTLRQYWISQAQDIIDILAEPVPPPDHQP
jgi:hypothetical protein